MQNRAKDHFRQDGGHEDPREAVAFMAELAGELSGIARLHRFDTLAYILDMARLEAESIRRGMGDEEARQD